MQTNLERAESLLNEEITLAAVCGERVLTYSGRTVKQLLALAEGDALKGASVADKIVGKAAALLLIKCGVKEVYAKTASRAAEAVLKRHGVPFSYGVMTDCILNRDGTGPCPMEATVADIEDCELAFTALNAKVAAMQGR